MPDLDTRTQEVQAAEAAPSLDELLETWQVHYPGGWENENSPTLGSWYAVSNDDGIVAYFGDEYDAFRFRLSEINRVLNG